MIRKSILIIALSARPFVAAAKRAGYVVTAIDAFADKQTVELADTTIIIDYDNHGFDADALLAAVSTLDASLYAGFVYGSGFEAQSKLLQKIADIIPVIGNAPATVGAVKTASSFFSALQQARIAHPAVFGLQPVNHHSDVYLRKFAGGCGGTHIKIASGGDAELDVNHYYQQYIAGRSVSLLFIARPITDSFAQVEVIGFNEQWLSPTAAMPFRYGGAVSHIKLPHTIQQQLIDAAEKLTIKFGLLGLNSLDAIVRNDVAYVLEINPRLSATFDLYKDADVNLLDRHVQVSLKQPKLGHEMRHATQLLKQSKAHAIVYATSNIEVSATFEWPNWVVDNPHHTTQHDAIKIPAGEPVCTVLAVADHADEAKQLAQTRVKILLDLLKENC